MSKQIKTTILVALFLPSIAAIAEEQRSQAQTTEISRAPAEAVEAWKDMRYGMFIHWGPVALTGHEIGWSRGKQTPIAEYDQLYKRFNPVEFDADEWVRVAKDAGMKYVVLTAKHHDGFCLWPSQYTDYDISETPFKRDVVGELAEACRKAGLRFGVYYSTLDWWHPDYPKGSPAGKTNKPDAVLERYIEYMKNQTIELVENYGPLSTVWFDVPDEVYQEHNEPTVQALRKLQPDIMINDRAYSPKETGGDYNTPEQHVGGFDRDRPWETCMTIAKQWAWKPNDPVKSLNQCLRALLGTIGGDGNFLFNVGPDALGVIAPEQVERLMEMGQWVEKYHEGIHATRGGPFIPGGWGASTHKADAIYLFVFRWPTTGKLLLPLTAATITGAESLSGGDVTVNKVPEGYELFIPGEFRDPIATVIRLKVNTPAALIEPIVMSSISGSLAYQKPAKATRSSFSGPAVHAFDDEPDSVWKPKGRKDVWIEVDLETPQPVSRVELLFHTAKFEEIFLQYKDGNEWKTILTASKPDGDLEETFEPVTAQHFRVLVKEGLIRLREFRLFPVE